MSPILEAEHYFGQVPDTWRKASPNTTMYQIDRTLLHAECNDQAERIILNVSVTNDERVVVKEKVVTDKQNGTVYNYVTHTLTRGEVNDFFDQKNLIPSDNNPLRFRTVRWVPQEEIGRYTVVQRTSSLGRILWDWCKGARYWFMM